jgi:D-lactate dehydrogenase (cytochrome)
VLVKNKAEEFQSYLEDTSNLKGSASLLYLPQTKEELSSAIDDCVNKKIPLTISAGRTGTTGGCVPLEGAVISLENLKKVIDIDRERQIVHLEAGVTLEELEKEVNKYNLTLRASPTESLAFIGGAVSTAASGVRGFGYGSIRKYVLDIEVALPSGEVIKVKRGKFFAKERAFDCECGGRRFTFNLPSYTIPSVKSQAGYFVADNMDLIDLFIGSEGTLGVIVAATLSLQKIPFNIFDGLVFFQEERNALGFVEKIRELKEKDLLKAASLEFFDSHSLDFLRPEYHFIPQKAEACVYFEQEAETEESFRMLLEKWAALIEDSGASLDASIVAETAKERRRVFEFRHRLPQLINEFLRSNRQLKCATDIAVPWKNFREMYGFYVQTACDAGIDYVNFGHAGQAHLHFNFLPKNEAQGIKAREYLKKFCQRAVSLGGTVSAEHGIGKIKKPFLKIMYSQAQIAEMAFLKKYFDQPCLLGLDNIFEKELLFKPCPGG